MGSIGSFRERERIESHKWAQLRALEKEIERESREPQMGSMKSFREREREHSRATNGVN